MVAPNAQMCILIADNDDGMRQALVEFLQEEGYATLESSRPNEARRLLREGNVDVAVLDVRLLDDNDPFDLSGVEVACNSVPEIPKVLVTRFDEPDFLLRVLNRLLEVYQGDRDNEPYIAGALINVFPANAGFEALLRYIQRAQLVGRRARQFLEESRQILERRLDNSAENRQQARLNHRFALALGLLGFIVLGMVLLLPILLPDQSDSTKTLSALSVLASLILEAVAGFLYKQYKDANQRLDRDQRELKELLEIFTKAKTGF